MNNIQISIIAPVFKVEKYIERFLLSVMSQTYNHSELECILVDDCTPDRSKDIAKKIGECSVGIMTIGLISLG